MAGGSRLSPLKHQHHCSLSVTAATCTPVLIQNTVITPLLVPVGAKFPPVFDGEPTGVFNVLTAGLSVENYTNLANALDLYNKPGGMTAKWPGSNMTVHQMVRKQLLLFRKHAASCCSLHNMHNLLSSKAANWFLNVTISACMGMYRQTL
jgi:hypothetical protein